MHDEASLGLPTLFCRLSTSSSSASRRAWARVKLWNEKMREYSLPHSASGTTRVRAGLHDPSHNPAVVMVVVAASYLGSDSLGSHGLVRKLLRARYRAKRWRAGTSSGVSTCTTDHQHSS